MLLFLFFFFFKQKTAYEMRISDWSSDVCSSDLERPGDGGGDRLRPAPDNPHQVDDLLSRRAAADPAAAGAGGVGDAADDEQPRQLFAAGRAGGRDRKSVV